VDVSIAAVANGTMTLTAGMNNLELT